MFILLSNTSCSHTNSQSSSIIRRNPRTDFASIEDYFVNFLKLKPQGEILESHVTIGMNTASDVGLYEVSQLEARNTMD